MECFRWRFEPRPFAFRKSLVKSISQKRFCAFHALGQYPTVNKYLNGLDEQNNYLLMMSNTSRLNLKSWGYVNCTLICVLRVHGVHKMHRSFELIFAFFGNLGKRVTLWRSFPLTAFFAQNDSSFVFDGEFCKSEQGFCKLSPSQVLVCGFPPICKQKYFSKNSGLSQEAVKAKWTLFEEIIIKLEALLCLFHEGSFARNHVDWVHKASRRKITIFTNRQALSIIRLFEMN